MISLNSVPEWVNPVVINDFVMFGKPNLNRTVKKLALVIGKSNDSVELLQHIINSRIEPQVDFSSESGNYGPLTIEALRDLHMYRYGVRSDFSEEELKDLLLEFGVTLV